MYSAYRTQPRIDPFKEGALVRETLVVVVLWSLLGAAPAWAQDAEPAEPQSAAAAGAESYYRLQPSDVIMVKYRYTPEYDATVTVQPDGFVALPIVGDVKVAGLTVSDARREIVVRASERLRDPDLSVELREFLRPRFVVGGEVGKPGQYELRGRVTLLEAVAMAGGFKTTAKHSQVLLFRRYDAERAVTRVVDAKALARADFKEEDPELRPGDFLFVPQNRISKVERFVPFSSVGWLLNLVIP